MIDLVAPSSDPAILPADVSKRRETRKERQKYRPEHPSRISRLGGLRAYDPDAWELEVRAALEAAGNRVGEAAKILEISRVQMFRWMKDPRFADVPRLPPGPPPPAADPVASTKRQRPKSAK